MDEVSTLCSWVPVFSIILTLLLDTLFISVSFSLSFLARAPAGVLGQKRTALGCVLWVVVSLLLGPLGSLGPLGCWCILLPASASVGLFLNQEVFPLAF